jgi:hypothetical protein
MLRQKIKSSLIEELGYDASRQELEIQFKDSGKVYTYSGIPPEMYTELMAAPSIGSYFTTKIKPRYRGMDRSKG